MKLKTLRMFMVYVTLMFALLLIPVLSHGYSFVFYNKTDTYKSFNLYYVKDGERHYRAGGELEPNRAVIYEYKSDGKERLWVIDVHENYYQPTKRRDKDYRDRVVIPCRSGLLSFSDEVSISIIIDFDGVSFYIRGHR